MKTFRIALFVAAFCAAVPAFGAPAPAPALPGAAVEEREQAIAARAAPESEPGARHGAAWRNCRKAGTRWPKRFLTRCYRSVPAGSASIESR
jgi:hypothetical protein